MSLSAPLRLRFAQQLVEQDVREEFDQVTQRLAPTLRAQGAFARVERYVARELGAIHCRGIHRGVTEFSMATSCATSFDFRSLS